MAETFTEDEVVGHVRAGARDCAGFLADVKTSPNLGLSYFSWAQGYMSHRNTVEKEKSGHDVNLTPKSFDYTKQYEAMGNFCVINSTAHFAFHIVRPT
jgi:hypothetical protein